MNQMVTTYLYDVSVVMAVKNEAIYLEEAVLSIAQQRGLKFELIVVDDGSTDDTYRIATDLARQFSMIRVLRNPGHGKVNAFNFGVYNSRGAFVCVFAGDDIMPDGSLFARWASIREYPGAVVGLSKIQIMSEIPRYNGHVLPRGKNRGSLSGQSPLISRAALDHVFPVPESLPNEDTWMELALLLLPDVVLVHSDVICCKWRLHGGNSYNITQSYEKYRHNITIRQEALFLFFRQHGAALNAEARRELAGRMECEKQRRVPSLSGIVLCRASARCKLRALSTASPILFLIRRWFYALMSGW